MLDVITRLGVYPRYCVLELTLRCNLRCMHCGSHAGTPRPDELTTEEWLRVAEQLADEHCEHVTLGGGEPTLLRDWPLIARRLVDRGVKVNIITNGRTWDHQLTRAAVDVGLWNVCFSLDGLRGSHDFVRRSPGSFEHVLAGLDHCVASAVPTAVVTHINSRNISELPAMRELLCDHGVGLWQVQIGTPAGSMSEHPELVIRPADLLHIIPLLAEIRSRPGGLKLIVSDNVGYYGKYERAIRNQEDHFGFWIGCRSGLQVLGIESNGNVKGCLSLPSTRHGKDSFVMGNLRTSSLAEIWNRQGAFCHTREFAEDDLGGFCRSCPYRDICRGGCLWVSYCSSGAPRENPYCFYRVAVENEAFDLLDDEDVGAMVQQGRRDARCCKPIPC